MSILFIADLHLSQSEPEISAGFLHFLRHHASQAQALYILGDLFEFWVGDDDPDPLHQRIADALHQLHEQGVALFFTHGNRDFLLGNAFAARGDITLLPQECLVDLYGRNALILHGDILCSDDQTYQRYRRLVQNPIIQQLFLLLPLSWRLNIATRLRNRSQRSYHHKAPSLMDVNQDTVATRLQYYGVQLMIHGHTHRPAIHDFTLDGKPAQRIVLGDWHHSGWMLKVTPEQLQLIEFPFSDY